MAEAFTWGAGGAKLTPEQLALARALLNRKKSQGIDTSPVGHWTAGAARVVDALGDVVQERRLNNQQAENDQYNVSQTEPLIAALSGGSAATVAAPVGAAVDAAAPATIDISGDKQTFIQSLLPAAIEEGARTGVDPRIIVAQAAQETGWGKSAPGNNYFGIKSHGQSGGQTLATNEVINGKTVRINDSFRQFASPADSVRGYGDFILQNPRYEGLRTAQGLDGQLQALQASGYATDPNYSRSVGAIARSIPLPQNAAGAIEAAAPSASFRGSDYNSPMLTYDDKGARVERPYTDPMVSVQPAAAPALPTPVNVASQPVAAVAAPQQTAPPPAILAQALRVMADPRANENTKAVAQALIQRQQAQEQAAQEQSVWQQRQAYQQQQQNSDPLRQAQIAQAQAQAEKLRRDASNPNGDETFYGNTVPIQNPDGSISYGQMGNRGTFRPIQLPEGQTFAPPTRTIDAGTETVVIDQAGNVISRVPKQNREAAAETAGGTVQGRTQAEKQISAPADFQSAQNAIDILDQIENHPARKAGTGGTSIFNAIPGTSGYDFQNLVNQAKSGAFLTAIESMKGLGALSNAEGGAATAAVTRMDTATTEEGFMSALSDYRKIVSQGMERARKNIPEGQRPAMETTSQPQKKRLKFTATGELVE